MVDRKKAICEFLGNQCSRCGQTKDVTRLVVRTRAGGGGRFPKEQYRGFLKRVLETLLGEGAGVFGLWCGDCMLSIPVQGYGKNRVLVNGLPPGRARSDEEMTALLAPLTEEGEAGEEFPR